MKRLLIIAGLASFTACACIVNDELFGLITIAFWMFAGVAKILAAHEEYQNRDKQEEITHDS